MVPPVAKTRPKHYSKTLKASNWIGKRKSVPLQKKYKTMKRLPVITETRERSKTPPKVVTVPDYVQEMMSKGEHPVNITDTILKKSENKPMNETEKLVRHVLAQYPPSRLEAMTRKRSPPKASPPKKAKKKPSFLQRLYTELFE